MPGRDKDLITKNGMPIPQSYNPQAEDWESYIGVSWGKTAGGLYVPVAVTDEGHVKVQQSGDIRETKTITGFELAAGATHAFDMNVETADKVALMVLLHLETSHDVTVVQRYRVGDYSSSTILIKEIPLESPGSRFRVSGVEPIISPGGTSLRITNNSTETQIYEGVHINLYRRVYHAG